MLNSCEICSMAPPVIDEPTVLFMTSTAPVTSTKHLNAYLIVVAISMWNWCEYIIYLGATFRISTIYLGTFDQFSGWPLSSEVNVTTVFDSACWEQVDELLDCPCMVSGRCSWESSDKATSSVRVVSNWISSPLSQKLRHTCGQINLLWRRYRICMV